MTLTVFALAQEAKSLRKLAEKVALTEALAPKTFVISDDMKQFYDTRLGEPAPVKIIEVLPTGEGKRRYEPGGYYEGIPCTCKETCSTFCKGQCGCDACSSAYGDAME